MKAKACVLGSSFIVLLTLIFAVTLVEGKAKKNKKAVWLSGVWEGTGYQLNNGSTWSIKFVGDSENQTYTIEYPSLKCSGTWQAKKISATMAEFVETITVGKTLCLDGGTVIVTRIDERYMTFTYLNPDTNDLGSFSTLINSRAK